MPDIRRLGFGRRLHDLLLAGVTAHRALFSTDNADSPAVRLYASRSWHKLEELSPDSQVMGLDLRR